MGELKKLEIKRDTSIVMASALEKIRLLYGYDPNEAGKFAIAYLERLFTEADSFGDDFLIQTNLTELTRMGQKSNSKYDEKVERTNEKNYVLAARLAGYERDGLKQKEMAQREGKSESWLSGKIREARINYPELFARSLENSEKVQENLGGVFNF